MIKHSPHIVILLLFAVITSFAPAKQVKKYTIFYLCIGSEHYEKDFDKYLDDFSGLHNLPEARTSALKMQELFTTELLAKSGRIILSEKNNPLTRVALMQATHDLVKDIKKSKAPNPLVFFYYCGHGFSSKEIEGHFIPPGDFVHNPDSLDLEGWGEQAVAATDIYEAIVNNGISLVMLLDCCHSGEQKQPDLLDDFTIKSLGLEQMDGLMKATYELLKASNRMVGYEPVIFSTEAGKSVTTVEYNFTEGSASVGPLCRKSYIVLKEKLNDVKEISVSDFTIMIKSPELDTATIPAISFWNFNEKNLGLIKQ